MTTWGELGNFLSGSCLVSALKSKHPDYSIDIVPAEYIFPVFEEVGRRIRRLSLEATTAAERYEQYCDCLNYYEETYFSRIESTFDEADFAKLKVLILNTNPDVIIGTKGVIARVCSVLVERLGLTIPVVNYVTNHGHFMFKIHDCNLAAGHIGRYPESAEALARYRDFPRDRIRVVGYLLGVHILSDKLYKDRQRATDQSRDDVKTTVFLVSNRDANNCLELVQYIDEHLQNLTVKIIIIKNQVLREQVQQLSFSGNNEIVILNDEPQEVYFSLLNAAQHDGRAIYISKASPNAIFECTYFGVPMLLFRSGLPIEEWAIPKMEEERLGHVFDGTEGLKAKLKEWIDNPALIDECRRTMQTYADEHLDQQATIDRISAAIHQFREDYLGKKAYAPGLTR